ncbi:helix-turn-helix domain-containing protein [Mesorhizobium sp. YC-39]|uniref:helix-turn-helix domain-containing protein n=1 Tax=unclassified Mesorhizobium TaxID=325217 RepID=UPI0021E8BACE|nr:MULTISPECIES: helix-turn-helix transcriptional regulator [unclassified Mesorhizobium]MCV3209632.1 helix-turn-helix domain-containing protein [Mesorhizobium sp. YC-2]MCV3230162.1 helix-turn-helix domain-containing protein [Mesorhizobium sp. YC-39]
MRNNFSMAQNPSDEAPPTYFFREWRKYRGFNQETLAEKVNLTASSISQLENGKQGFSDSTLVALARALDCRPGDLLLWEPGKVDALPIRGADEVRKVLGRIEGLKPENITALLSVIEGFQQANAAQSQQALRDDRSEPATSRHVSTPSQ